MADLDQLADAAVAAPPAAPPSMAELRARSASIRRARRLRWGGAVAALVALVGTAVVVLGDGEPATRVDVRGPAVDPVDRGGPVPVASAAATLAAELRTARLIEQRTRTDQAAAAYVAVADDLDAGNPAADPARAEVTARLEGLATVRAAVDGRQIGLSEVVDQYARTIDDVADVLAELPDGSDVNDEASGLQVAARLGRAFDARARQVALLTLVVAEGGWVRWDLTGAATPCGPEPEGCALLQDVDQATDEVEQATAAFQDLASPDQKLLLRDAEAAGADLATWEAALVDAGRTGAPVADIVSLEDWLAEVDALLEAQQRASAALLATVGSADASGSTIPPETTVATAEAPVAPEASTTIVPTVEPMALPDDLVASAPELSVPDLLRAVAAYGEPSASEIPDDYDLLVERRTDWGRYEGAREGWSNHSVRVVVAVRGGEVVRGSVVATDGPPEDVDLRQLTLEAVLAGEGIDISASGSMWLCLRDEATVVRQCLSSHMHASLPTQTVVVLGFAER